VAADGLGGWVAEDEGALAVGAGLEFAAEGLVQVPGELVLELEGDGAVGERPIQERDAEPLGELLAVLDDGGEHSRFRVSHGGAT
jgi:hypothetical protein